MEPEENANNTMSESQEDGSSFFPATVVSVINNFKVAISRGSKNGIRNGQRFLIYALSSDKMTDPETGESLGYLEIVRGTGYVVHVQETMATIESDKQSSNKIKKKSNFLFAETIEEVQHELIPFEDPEVGDKARPI